MNGRTRLSRTSRKARQLLTADENRAVIGFLDEAMPGRRQTASQIAFYNNQRERQWGVSPRDRAALMAVLLNYRPLVTLQEMQARAAISAACGSSGSGNTSTSFQK